jgi:hypothetical protein
VDITVIVLWLGHESSETTHQYVEADLEMQRRALDRIAEPPIKSGRRKKFDGLLDFRDRLFARIRKVGGKFAGLLGGGVV